MFSQPKDASEAAVSKVTVGMELAQFVTLPSGQIQQVGVIRAGFETTPADAEDAVSIIKTFEDAFGSKLKTSSLSVVTGHLNNPPTGRT